MSRAPPPQPWGDRALQSTLSGADCAILHQVASSTSAFMILFTSSSNLVHYLFEGVLAPEPGYVVWGLCLGFISALTGRLLSLRLVHKLHHPSLLIFSLGILLLLALVLLIARSAGTPADWTFAPLCGGSS